MSETMMTASTFEVIQLRFDSAKSFEAVRSALLDRMGAITPEAMLKIIGAAQNAEQFELGLAPFIGESGFTLLAEIDHSRWLRLYGIKRKATRLVFGNPTIAITMIRHDLAAALFAPVEILLFENEDGDGCTVIYDQPSALMQARKTPELLAAAQALDAKLKAFVSTATATAAD